MLMLRTRSFRASVLAGTLCLSSYCVLSQAWRGFGVRSILGMSISSGTKQTTDSLPLTCGEDVMSQKEHGTCPHPVQSKLRWDCSVDTADNICCFNRHFAEYSGYWETTSFLSEADREEPITFYDSVTGKPLFRAPIDRTFEEFEKESRSHGWPSFRDQEVVWDNVRCLENGEAVSLDGTHLGHNIPDRKGNRYCINLVSVAGYPEEEEELEEKE